MSSRGVDASRVLLVSGLWPYPEVDEKKSLRRLNVMHNDELRQALLGVAGVGTIHELGYDGPDGPVPLFIPNEEVQPTLVSVALRALISDRAEVTECRIADLVDEDHGDALALDPDQVCLVSTSYVTTFRDLTRVIELLRRAGLRFIVCGGFLATRNPERTMDVGADAVIRGDAEEALPMLLDALRAGSALDQVPNLFYRDAAGDIQYTYDRLVLLDSIPVAIPEGDLSDMAIPYESMRGCPYKCGFCSYPLASPKWRFKSARKVLDDFTTIEERGATNIIALDSTFTIPYRRLREFLDLVMERGLSIPWGAYSRVTPLNDEGIVEKLRRANNRWLSIGFESGSQRLLDIMNKGTRMKDAHAALVNMRKYEISPWSNFIVGYPGETEETLGETVEFMGQHLFGFYGLYVFNIRDRAMPVLGDSFADVHYDDVGSEWSHVTMDSEQATELRWQAYLDVATANADAITIDVFRGTNVANFRGKDAEKDYGAWSPAFALLKDIERFALCHAAADEASARGLRRDEIEERIRRSTVPLSPALATA